MNIAFVTCEFVTENNFDGGLANYLYKISKALVTYGHSVTIFVTTKNRGVIDFEGIKVVRISSKFVNVVNVVLKGIFKAKFDKTISYLIQSYQVNKCIKQFSIVNNIDIIQYSSYQSIGFFRLKNIPTVVRISSFTQFWRIANDQPTSIDDIISESMEIESIRKVDGVYGPSFFIANKLKLYIEKEIPIIETINDEKIEISNIKVHDRNYILFFGTISKLKGFDLLITIFDDFFHKYSNYDIIAIGKSNLVGFNPDELMAKYNNRFIYFDKMKKKDLLPYISQSSAVIIPSRIDNLPNTCIESMTLGKIVIASNNSGIDQLIVDGETGILFENSDSQDLLNAIDRLMKLDNTDRDRFVKNIYSRVSSLKQSVIVPKLLYYYESVIKDFKEK